MKNLKQSEIKDFEKWYEEERKKQFNFKEEMFSYVESDTLLLMEGCLSFR